MLNTLMGIPGAATDAAVMCHRSSNAMLYAVTVTVVLWAICSVIAWRRYFNKQPAAAQVPQST